MGEGRETRPRARLRPSRHRARRAPAASCEEGPCMSRSVQPSLGPMEVTPVDPGRSTTVNEVDREREWLGLVPRAFGKSGLTHKAAAAELEIDRGQLAAQLAGVPNKHLSFRRM